MKNSSGVNVLYEKAVLTKHPKHKKINSRELEEVILPKLEATNTSKRSTIVVVSKRNAHLHSSHLNISKTKNEEGKFQNPIAQRYTPAHLQILPARSEPNLLVIYPVKLKTGTTAKHKHLLLCCLHLTEFAQWGHLDLYHAIYCIIGRE